MKVEEFVKTNIEKIDQLEKKLIALKQTIKTIEPALKLTFFSQDWKDLLGLKWYFYTFLLFYFKDSISYDWFLFGWIAIIIFSLFLFGNIILSTFVYFNWLHINRKIKILQTEIEFRFLYVKNFLHETEKSLKNHEQS